MVMGTDYSMRIWLKPDVMAQYKLMPSDVSVALAEQSSPEIRYRIYRRNYRKKNLAAYWIAVFG